VSDDISQYDYNLPDCLIARHPPAQREDARLLVVNRAAGTFEHRGIRDLPELLHPGDSLVLNDTQVLKARLRGRRRRTGGRWEGLFLESLPDGSWRLMGQTRGKLQPGEQLAISPAEGAQSSGAESPEELILELIEREGEGVWRVRPLPARDPLTALAKFGAVPLPPYMERDSPDADDIERYQTTYARHPGSVAAPTAGLHFTPELLSRCRERGIDHTFVTLHVGVGTFRPISTERLADHRMHSEWCELPAAAADQLTQVRARGGRIVAVGTTSARTLETATRDGTMKGWRGQTDLFIKPPYRVRAVDALLTNFHLPRSTLLVLVCTFADRDLMLAAYAEAIRQEYRFYSYGDAMLIV
jgi:S-adenosylmethionine:tRNA ribosyltransferase-isomerase